MVERVARAMYGATPFKETEGGYDSQSETYRKMCEILARAAIEAMHEPTIPMLDAYWDQCGESKEMRERTHSYARRYYQAMISEALSE